MEALDKEIEVELGAEWIGLRWLAMEAILLFTAFMRSFSKLCAIESKLGIWSELTGVDCYDLGKY